MTFGVIVWDCILGDKLIVLIFYLGSSTDNSRKAGHPVLSIIGMADGLNAK